MIYTELTKKALNLSYKKHKSQVDKSGMPYIYHPFIIASEMVDEATICVALLHDILEDTDLSINELYDYGFTEEIVTAIKIMTHQKEEDYFDYIERVKANKIAKTVKIADLKHNSDLSRLNNISEEDLNRVKKYKKALEILIDDKEFI